MSEHTAITALHSSNCHWPLLRKGSVPSASGRRVCTICMYVYSTHTYISSINKAYYYCKGCFCKLHYWINFSVCGLKADGRTDGSYSGMLHRNGTIQLTFHRKQALRPTSMPHFWCHPCQWQYAGRTQYWRQRQMSLCRYHTFATRIWQLSQWLLLLLFYCHTVKQKMRALQVSLLCPLVLLVKVGWM